MNKYQVIWLLIRLAGVYLAFLTLATFFGLLGAIPALFTLPKIDANPKNANIAVNQNQPIRVQPISPNFGNSNAPETVENKEKTGESLTDKFRGENVKNFAWFLILTAVYGAAAWYLLRDGRILYAVLNREKPDAPTKEKEKEVTTLNLSDEQS